MPALTILSSPQRQRSALDEVLSTDGAPGADWQVRWVEDPADLPAALRGADALLLWDFTSHALQGALGGADRLRWIHSASAGVDQLPYSEVRGRGITVTNARGMFDRPIAEYVAGCLLDFAKDTHRSARLQAARVWRHRLTEDLAGTRALIVGTGAIGRQIARTLGALGVEVAGAGTRARGGDPDFGDVVDSAQLAAHVVAFDWLINATPLTPATTGLIDAAVFAAMRPTARLVTIGRGPTVITADLVTALRDGQIAGAALDVVDPEPLPEDHPLWALPTAVLTPHMSGDTHGWERRLAQQFAANLERFEAGRPLENTIDLDKGYAAS